MQPDKKQKERERESVKHRVVSSATCSIDKDPPHSPGLYFTHTAVPIMVVWTPGPPERVKEWEAETAALCVCMRVCARTRARIAICCCAHYEAGGLLGHRHGQVSTPSTSSLLLSFTFSHSHTLSLL